MSFLSTLFELYMVLVNFPQRERELGTLAFAVWIILANVAANIFFLMIMAALSVVELTYAITPNFGLWPLIMVQMSSQMLRDPNGSTSFWGVLIIPNKWYPLALVGFFSLLSSRVAWNLVAAVAVSYIAFVYPAFHLDRLLPSHSWISSVEQRFLLQQRTIFGGNWMTPGSGAAFSVSGGNRPAPSVCGRQLGQASPASKGFTVFSGSGNRLGSVDEELPQVASATPTRSPELDEEAQCLVTSSHVTHDVDSSCKP